MIRKSRISVFSCMVGATLAVALGVAFVRDAKATLAVALANARSMQKLDAHPLDVLHLLKQFGICYNVFNIFFSA